MFDHVHDPALAALQRLGPDDLARITGTPGARLLRARYKPGARAVLHVALGTGDDAAQGSIWLFAGDKARKLARELPDARLDATTGALFQTFPHDHRLPQLAGFAASAMTLAQHLIGGRAAGPPQLMRYRPGLSATFRWVRQDGQVFYVKQMPDADIAAQDMVVAGLLDAASGSVLDFTPVAGTLPDLGLIAYHCAKGRPLDQILPLCDPDEAQQAMAQTVTALQVLWALPVMTDRMLDRAALLHRAQQACEMIGLFDPATGHQAAQLVAGLQAQGAAVRLRPVHADMKLDHAFLSGRRTTLIDIESLSLGDPDYDLAKLDARIAMAEALGQITAATAAAARHPLLRLAGPHYDWFLTCARLQSAKFFAHRLDPATIPQMRRVLGL